MSHVAALTAEMMAKYDRPGPRYTSYPTAVEFHENFTEPDYRERLAQADREREARITSYNVCYTKLLRSGQRWSRWRRSRRSCRQRKAFTARRVAVAVARGVAVRSARCGI